MQWSLIKILTIVTFSIIVTACGGGGGGGGSSSTSAGSSSSSLVVIKKAELPSAVAIGEEAVTGFEVNASGDVKPKFSIDTAGNPLVIQKVILPNISDIEIQFANTSDPDSCVTFNGSGNNTTR